MSYLFKLARFDFDSPKDLYNLFTLYYSEYA